MATVGADESRAGLADPKDKVHLFNKIAAARDLGRDESDLPRAMAMIEEVVKEDPKVIDAWFTLGNMSARRGRHEDDLACQQSVTVDLLGCNRKIHCCYPLASRGRPSTRSAMMLRWISLEPP